MKAWTAKDQGSCSAGPISGDGTVNVAAGPDGAGYWQEYEYDLLGNRTTLVEKDLTGNTAKDAVTEYVYGKADGSQPGTLTRVTKRYVTPDGAQVTAEVERLYELTGETKSVTSVQNGDTQELTWTYDGQVERITGQGSNGKTAYIGLADKCLDLKSALAQAGQPIQLYSCNATVAQKWTFTPAPSQADPDLGTLSVYDAWCVQPAGSAAGSAVQTQKCDGSAAQRLERTSAGQLRHPASGLCLAVKDGGTADGTPIVLAAYDANSTAQRWEAQDETRHIYGPDGARLLTVQGRQAPLHLGEAEVTVLRGGALVNSQRSYPVPGGTVLRFAHGSNSPRLVAIAGDHQGSPYAEVALEGGMPVRIRKQDPFGNQRAAAPLGENLQTHAGFLGATRDDASGFVPLGARLYDPVVGRFLSADPVLDLADPLQANGYAYAHNNPVTLSDPSGLAVTAGSGSSVSLTLSEYAAALRGAGLTPAQVAQAQAAMNRSLASVILSAAWDVLAEFIGINDAVRCFNGDLWSCGSLIISSIPWGKLAKLPKVKRAIDRTIAAIQAWKAQRRWAEGVLRSARAAEAAAIERKKADLARAARANQAGAKKPTSVVDTTSNRAVNTTKKTGNRFRSRPRPKPIRRDPRLGPAVPAVRAPVVTGKPGGSAGASSRSNGGSSGSGGSGRADGVPPAPSTTASRLARRC